MSDISGVQVISLASSTSPRVILSIHNMSDPGRSAWYSSNLPERSQRQSQHATVEEKTLPSQSLLATSTGVTEGSAPATSSLDANATSAESFVTGLMLPEQFTWDSGLRDFSKVTYQSKQHLSIPKPPAGLPQGKDSGTIRTGSKIDICEQWIRDLRNRRRFLKGVRLKDGNSGNTSGHEKELDAIAKETEKWAEWRAELLREARNERV